MQHTSLLAWHPDPILRTARTLQRVDGLLGPICLIQLWRCRPRPMLGEGRRSDDGEEEMQDVTLKLRWRQDRPSHMDSWARHHHAKPLIRQLRSPATLCSILLLFIINRHFETPNCIFSSPAPRICRHLEPPCKARLGNWPAISPRNDFPSSNALLLLRPVTLRRLPLAETH
jgi:hypothetical protein